MPHKTPIRKIYLKRLREKYVRKFFEQTGNIEDILVLKDIKKGYRERNLQFIFYSVKENIEKNYYFSKHSSYREEYEYFFDYGIWGRDSSYFCLKVMK